MSTYNLFYIWNVVWNETYTYNIIPHDVFSVTINGQNDTKKQWTDSICTLFVVKLKWLGYLYLKYIFYLLSSTTDLNINNEGYKKDYVRNSTHCHI